MQPFDDRSSRREFLTGLAGATAGLALSGISAAQTPASSTKPHRIDVHCHLVPPAYLAFLKANYPDMPRGYSPPPWSVEKHIEDMDKGGVSISMVSLPRPGVWYGGNIEVIRKITRECNEYNAKLVADHPGRFGFMATLPLTDVEGSLREAVYALDTLKADGIALKTPYGDKGEIWHGDALFGPLWEELNRRKVVTFTHPQEAWCCSGDVSDARGPKGVGGPTIEYGTNTTRTIASLLYSGTASKYPDIKWIFSHAGGTMPFLVQRLIGEPFASYLRDGGVVAPGAPKVNTSQAMPKGSLYELQRFYYETANTENPVAMGALRKVVPLSQILFGSDFPYHESETVAKGLSVSQIFNPKELMAVERDNAANLFPKTKTS